MPHFRVDDALHSHPKAQRAGDDAIGMWVRAGSFCMAYLTDGFVPDWWVRQQPKGVAKAKRLIAAGLWHGGAEREGERGYQFHEFTGPGRQDSRAQIEADREKWRKKKAAQRAESQGESPGDTHQESPGDTKFSDDENNATQRTVHTQYNGQYTDKNPHTENAPTSATTQMSPGESRVLPNTNPTKENSTHLRDDNYVTNNYPPYPPDDERAPKQRPRRATGAELARSNFAAIPTSSSQLAGEIVRAYGTHLGTPVDPKTAKEMTTAIDAGLQAGQTPAQIAAGIELWAASDSFAPSQIPKFVTKAAAARKRNGIGKPTEQGDLTIRLAEELIAEMDQP